LDSTQAPTVWCPYALTNEIAAAIVIVAAIAVRITVSADPKTKTAKSASAKSATMATAAMPATMAAMPSRLSSAYIDDQRQRDDPKNFCKFRHRRTSNVTPRKLIFIQSP
jgi:hypothetical protein